MSETTTPVAPEVQTGHTEESAAAALLAKWGGSPDAEEETQPEADDQPEGDGQEQETEAKENEAEEGEGEESEAQSEDVEIDVAGEKFKLPPQLAEQAKRIEAKAKEVEAGATRKFQEAADLRKFADAQLESVKKMQEVATQQADIIADHRSVMRRMQQIEQTDFSAMAEQDPVALTRLNAEYMQLQGAKQRIENAYQQADAKMQQETQAQEAQRFTRLAEYAQKNIKGWSDEYSNTLLDFSVKQLGADPDALRSVMSEPVIKALDYAYRGWKMSQMDPKAKQVIPSKTLKPGGTGQMKTSAVQAVEKAQQRLKKSNSVDDAAALLLARSNARKR